MEDTTWLCLTEEHRRTIRLALLQAYDHAMKQLNLMGPYSLWLQDAGEAWDAYRVFTGRPIYGA